MSLLSIPEIIGISIGVACVVVISVTVCIYYILNSRRRRKRIFVTYLSQKPCRNRQIEISILPKSPTIFLKGYRRFFNSNSVQFMEENSKMPEKKEEKELTKVNDYVENMQRKHSIPSDTIAMELEHSQRISASLNSFSSRNCPIVEVECEQKLTRDMAEIIAHAKVHESSVPFTADFDQEDETVPSAYRWQPKGEIIFRERTQL